MLYSSACYPLPPGVCRFVVCFWFSWAMPTSSHGLPLAWDPSHFWLSEFWIRHHRDQSLRQARTLQSWSLCSLHIVEGNWSLVYRTPLTLLGKGDYKYHKIIQQMIGIYLVAVDLWPLSRASIKLYYFEIIEFTGYIVCCFPSDLGHFLSFLKTFLLLYFFSDIHTVHILVCLIVSHIV